MLSENLARLQAERGETNYRLAKILGVHQSSIANWKSGKIAPHPKQAVCFQMGSGNRAAGDGKAFAAGEALSGFHGCFVERRVRGLRGEGSLRLRQ